MAGTVLLLVFCLFLTCHSTAGADFGNIEITGRIPTRGLIDRIASAPDNDIAYGIGTISKTLSIIDRNTHKAQARFPSRHGPAGLAVNPVNNNAFVLCQRTSRPIANDGSLTIVVSPQGQIVASRPPPRTYSGYGELDGITYTVGGTNTYGCTLARDTMGRITKKVETIDGSGNTWDYAYDDNGRLTEVKKDGAVAESYTYDSQGNRTLETNTLRGISNRVSTYSDKDHIITAGTDTYQFNVDGSLTSKTSGSLTTSYQYSSRGELLSTTLPDGRAITYNHDPLGHRVAKRVNGTIAGKWRDALNV
jgi:YD repeat-containing protein